MLNMRGVVVAALLFTSGLTGIGPASAVPITYDFAGTVVGNGAGVVGQNDIVAEAARLRALLPGSLGGGPALIFRPLLGSLTVDSDAVDLSPSPTFGAYRGFGLISAFTLSFEGFDFSLDPGRPGTSVSGSVFNTPSFDLVSLFAVLGTGLLSGSASGLTTQLGLSFDAFANLDNLELINSDRVPDLALLRDFLVTLEFIDTNGSSVSVGAQVDSLTRRVTVPEAGTALLFCLGMLTLLHRVSSTRVRRRR